MCCRTTQVHAAATEEFLTGKSLLDPATVQGALAALQAEVRPEPDPELSAVEYRASLTTSLLYKVRRRGQQRADGRG